MSSSAVRVHLGPGHEISHHICRSQSNLATGDVQSGLHYEETLDESTAGIRILHLSVAESYRPHNVQQELLWDIPNDPLFFPRGGEPPLEHTAQNKGER